MIIIQSLLLRNECLWLLTHPLMWELWDLFKKQLIIKKLSLRIFTCPLHLSHPHSFCWLIKLNIYEDWNERREEKENPLDSTAAAAAVQNSISSLESKIGIELENNNEKKMTTNIFTLHSFTTFFPLFNFLFFVHLEES